MTGHLVTQRVALSFCLFFSSHFFVSDLYKTRVKMVKWSSYLRPYEKRPIPFNRRRPGRPAGGRGYTGAASAPRRLPKNRMRSRTRTRTMQKRKRRVKHFVGAGLNGSGSMCHIGTRSWKTKGVGSLAKKVLGRQVISESNARNATSAIGKQGITLYAMLTTAELTAISTAANAGVVTGNPVKPFVFECKSKLHVRNQHNSLVTMIVYDLMAKRQSPSTAFDNPEECWERGLTDAGVAAGHSLNVGQTPSFSAEFRRYWRIKQTTKVLLEPGQQHEHTVYHKINRVLDSTAWAITPTSVVGLTTYTMIVFYGSLAHETATPTTVSFTAATLDIAQFVEKKFGYITHVGDTYTLTNTLPTTFLDADMMGENQDADVNPINA